MNNAIGIALMNDSKGRILVAQSREQIKKANMNCEEEYFFRKQQIKNLIEINRIPTKVPEGYTSRAERIAKQTARAGGEEFENALHLLRYARVSKQDWQNVLSVFA